MIYLVSNKKWQMNYVFSDKFECGSGGCIDFRKRCDTQLDCEDGSDEMDCQKSTCPENNFR